jgi:hypothetical protein
MQVVFGSSAKTEYCAGCGGELANGAGSSRAVVGNLQYHIGCTPEEREKAHWFYHSETCPTCNGRGRVAKP